MMKGYVTALLASVWMLFAPAAHANGPIFVDYQPGEIEDQLDRGKTVVVLYHDFWCQACKIQRKIIEDLRREHFDLNRMIYVVVPYEEYEFLPVMSDYDVDAVSTLLVLDRDKEIARMIRVTYEDAIHGFLELGLKW